MGLKEDQEEAKQKWLEHRARVRERVIDAYLNHLPDLDKDINSPGEAAVHQIAAILTLAEAVEALCDQVDWGSRYIGDMVQG